MPFLTVFTPSYNRAHTIKYTYESLCRQKCKDFIWIVVDDGSEDNTRELVSLWQQSTTDFEIQYIYKSNGGKHTALNLGFQAAQTELLFIVDSDDYLTDTAVSVIKEVWDTHKSNNLAGISFLRGNPDQTVIGDRFPAEGVFNDIDMRTRKHVDGDKAEVWRTDILKRYQFPVFPGERFQGENYVWWQIALEYDMYYVNKIIYIAEYLEGGLTKSGRTLRIRCPLGGMENSRMGLLKRFPLRERCKRAWLYVCYGHFAGKRFPEIVKGSGYPWLVSINYPFGWLLYLYWKKKYL